MGTMRLKGDKPRKKRRENIWRPYAREVKPKVKYSKNRQEIHDIARKAKEADMSYGEYVARYGDGL